MISKLSVINFFKNTLTNHNSFKFKSTHEINEKLSILTNNYKFKTTPRHHQKVGLLIGLMRNCFLFGYDMGTGKSKLILDIVEYRIYKGDIVKPILIVVPTEVAIFTWEEQINTHSNLTYKLMTETSIGCREMLLEGDIHENIIIISYSKLRYMLTALKKINRKNEFVLISNYMDRFKNNFDCVVYDEIHYIKNHRSLTFKICKQLSENIPYRYGLTGTICGQNQEDLWAVLYLIDLGKSLGKFITMFRMYFFNESIKRLSNRRIYNYKFKKGMYDELMSRIAHSSIYYKSEEVLDLPSINYEVIKVDIDEKARLSYNSAKTHLVSEGEITLQQLNKSFIHFRQITAGFLKVCNDDGSIINYKFTPTKVAALDSILNSIDEERKIIIFYEFVVSGEIIGDYLSGQKIKYTHLCGSTKDKANVVADFKRNSRVFMIQIRVGSMNLNLQEANYCIYYDQPLSVIDRKQSEKRLHRGDQKNTVFIYDLIAEDTVDEKIYKGVKEGKNVLESIMSSVKLGEKPDFF